MNKILSGKVRVERGELERFCTRVFEQTGLSCADSELSAKILVTADARGIPSHGVGRMKRYVKGIASGQMRTDTKEEILRETPSSLVIDAHGCMGFPVSFRTMNSVIGKAEQSGIAWACVGNSNHFGIAGYYAMMALPKDMIGIAMTNTAALGVPTFGRDVRFGTNPLAFCAPAGKEVPFCLDMATTTVTRGKLEVYDRAGKTLPTGWAVDAAGHPASDAGSVMNDMLNRRGGGLLPLGGFGELFSGFKGYGLSVMVDILSAVLADAPAGKDVFDTPETSGSVSHAFGAIRISAFCDPEKFKRRMDFMLRDLRETPRAEGCERVYYAGEKEFEADKKNTEIGIPLDEKTLENLTELAESSSIPPISYKVDCHE